MNSVQDGRVVDCVLFKQELHELAYKKSGAKNFDEYIAFANAASRASSGRTAQAKKPQEAPV
ncbi:MAG: hypothetical protein MdMp014T_0474 [Treponematales bacterium]